MAWAQAIGMCCGILSPLLIATVGQHYVARSDATPYTPTYQLTGGDAVGGPRQPPGAATASPFPLQGEQPAQARCRPLGRPAQPARRCPTNGPRALGASNPRMLTEVWSDSLSYLGQWLALDKRTHGSAAGNTLALLRNRMALRRWAVPTRAERRLYGEWRSHDGEQRPQGNHGRGCGSCGGGRR